MGLRVDIEWRLTDGCRKARERTLLRSEALLQGLGPEEAAAQVYLAHRHKAAWLDVFAESLSRRRAGASLAQALQAWGISQAEAARLLGVSRQAVGKWLQRGAPADRAAAFADLAAATELLVRYLKRDRIPAVVRRPIRSLGGVSLLDLLAQGRTSTVLAVCRDMFQFERAHR